MTAENGIAILENERFIYVDLHFAQIFGFTIPELIGRSWQCLHPADRVELLKAKVSVALAHSGEYRGEEIAIRKDGSTFYLGISLSSLPNSQLICTCRDLNAQQAALRDRDAMELSLRQSQLLYTQLMANIPAALYRFEIAADGTHRLKYVSARLFELLEIPATTALSTVALLFDRIAIEDRQGFYRFRENDTVFEQSWHWEGRWILASGKIKWMRAESQQKFFSDGASVWYGTLIDITDRKQIELQLLQTNQELLHATRSKDEFIANIGHEIRTPLNVILGISEILKEEIFGVLNHQQLESLLQIDLSGEQLLSLMNDILDISHIYQGKLELNISTVSVLSLCHSCLAFFKQKAFDKQIKLEIQVSSGAGNIAVDERRMRQVLLELLSNAIKFTPSGGLIVLNVTRHDREDDRGWIDFAIADTGIGIAPEDLNRLFQPFVQIDSKLNRQYIGAGLGLSLAQQLVECHGGKILIQSELGQGSCFAVRLPHTCLILDREFVAFDRKLSDDLNLN